MNYHTIVNNLLYAYDQIDDLQSIIYFTHNKILENENVCNNILAMAIRVHVPDKS